MSASDEVIVRIGEDTDASVLASSNVALAWETEHKELPLPVVTRGVQKLIENPQYGFYVVAERANTVVGSLMVTFEWSDWRCGLFWWIQSVYVHADFRRQGVFGRLYDFVKERASREPNVCGLRVYVEDSNRTAQSTYTKVGMKETSYSKIYEEMVQ